MFGFGKAAALAMVGILGAVFPAAASASSHALDWTKQAPAVHPSGRGATPMAYDAATGTVGLFGGVGNNARNLGDTWTWNGTTWTQQHPAAHPLARVGTSMAYDAATRTVLLFSGQTFAGGVPGDTWTWNGTTWT